MEKYYIMINGQQDGPYTKQEIKDKGFSNDSYIYNKNLGAWKKISEVPEFSFLTNEKKVETSPPRVEKIKSNQVYNTDLDLINKPKKSTEEKPVSTLLSCWSFPSASACCRCIC